MNAVEGDYMESCELMLLKRYNYAKRKDDSVDEERRSWSSLVTVHAWDVYEYNGTPYIVVTDWYNNEYNDYSAYPGHYRDLTLRVYPIDISDVDNETKVRGIITDTKGFKHRVDDVYVCTHDEEAFTDDIRRYVIRAIDAYLADQAK